MTKLYLDFETYSETPIKDGTYRYIEDCEPMLLAYAFDDEPPAVIDFTAGEKLPERVRRALSDPSVALIAHNAMFDRNVMRLALRIEVPIERWHCTMVRAMSHSLPGSLDALSDIFRLGDEAKIKDGKKLIQLFCKPTKLNKIKTRATRETHPEQWRRFVEYAKADIPACRRMDALLPKWNMSETERNYYLLDQKRNDLGVHVDVALAKAALRAVSEEQARLKKRTHGLTEGALDSTTQRDKTLEFILEQFGIQLPDLQGATLERRLDDPDIPTELKELLRIRLMVSTSSTAKYKALLKAVNMDSRLRGTIQFNGASRTGRDAGRTFQPQNLPSRGVLKQKEVKLGIRALILGVEDKVFDNVMLLTASVIRGALRAPEGRKYVVADLKNIEGRKLAWLAGEQWKLDAFAAYDAGHGHDLYNLTYAKSFSVDPATVTSTQRQVGKVQELALGYAGGVGAFLAFALAYGTDLEKMAEQAFPTLPLDVVKEAEGFYDWMSKRKPNPFGISRKVFVVCECFKRLWRSAHPQTVALWAALEDNTRNAIKHPGETFGYRDLTFRRDGAWFRLGLPSGRFLCYPSPQLDEKGGISYMGIHQYTRKWQRIGTHGGKLAENITQASSRDVFKHGEALAVKCGYDVVLPVHDELVTEVPDTDAYSVDQLAALMSTNPKWAVGLPLAAAGYEAYRYKKED